MPDDDTLRFLADMGVSWKVVEWLRSEGYDAIHLREEQLERLSDPDVFTKAGSERRVILTFDLDFSEIASFSGPASQRYRPSRPQHAYFPSHRKIVLCLGRHGRRSEDGSNRYRRRRTSSPEAPSHRPGG